MRNFRHLHTQMETAKISSNDIELGLLNVEYEVRRYVDTRNLGSREAFVISCKQRLTIPNKSFNTFGPQAIASYNEYPAMLICTLTPHFGDWGANCQLTDYFPRTLNTSVNSSMGSALSTGQSSSLQHTAGSSTSVTNSYDVQVSAGLTGDGLTAGVTAGFGHSETDTVEQSATSGQETSRGSELSSSDSMTMKDWGSYANIDNDRHAPTWVWGQEFPWNVLQLHNADENLNVTLPKFVQQRLGAGVGQVLPPSELSMFGIDFVSTARWTVFRDHGDAPRPVNFKHELTYYTATHTWSTTPPNSADESVTASLTNETATGGPFIFRSQAIDLDLLALDPIVRGGPHNGAVLGFAPTKFTVAPAPERAFVAISGSNNLYAWGKGFVAPASSDVPLTAAPTATAPAILIIKFKVADENRELALFLKHWRTGSAACVLEISVNDGEPIVRHVEARQAGSGADNVTTVILRNKDYALDEYFDYLVIGLNTVSISIKPSLDSSAGACGYALRALAVG